MARPTASPLGTWSWPLRRLGRRLLWLYWTICIAVIAAGAGKVWPGAVASLAASTPAPVEAQAAVSPAMPAQGARPQAAIEAPPDPVFLEADPAPALTRPFGNCTAAHAAGVYNIPEGSPAYDPRQDGDRDGWACEPPPGGRYG